jgi:hypothetical protein
MRREKGTVLTVATVPPIARTLQAVHPFVLDAPVSKQAAERFDLRDG